MASIVLFTLTLLLSPPDFLSGYAVRDAVTGPLYARGWAEADIAGVAEELPAILRGVEARLGRRLARPFTTVLAPGLADLSRIVERLSGAPPPSDRVMGVALPRFAFIIVREGLAPGSPPFRGTVTHEVTHLVLHRRADAVIPRWFDEGVATWISGSPRSPDTEAYISFLARAGLLYPIERLSYVIPLGDDAASTAYIQSFLLVEYLASRHGEAVISTLLDLFESGLDTPAALDRACGMSLQSLGADFADWLVDRRSFLEAISSVVNVWTVTTLLALVAIARSIVRRRRRLRALEAAESTRAADPPSSLEDGSG